MNTGQTPAHDKELDGADAHRRPALLIVLVVLLLAETALMIGVFAWLLLELMTAKPTSVSSGIAILVLAGVGALWVLITAIGALRARSWMRGAAITWQLVQAAVAIGCFQGLYALPGVGWALLIPAIIGVLLVLSPSVTSVTRRDPRAP